MGRLLGFARIRQVARSKSTLKVVGGAAAGALVVGMAAAGAAEATAAAPNKHSLVDSALYAQTTAETKPANNKLSVTVGKALSITAKPDGTPTLSAMVLNSQVSGQGSGEVKIPVGTDSVVNTGGFGSIQTANDSIVYDINSQSSQVQNLHASAGIFKGDPAVSMQVKTWVDGNPVEANDMADVTGNVRIEYIFTNNTAKDETITYKSSTGETVTEAVKLPAPMGGAFAVTFGRGWADIDAPWSLTGISPAGQELTGTAILFPPLGASTVTFPVNLRAQHATLPEAMLQAIPLNLETYSDGLLLNAPGKAAPPLDKLSAVSGTAAQKVSAYQQMLGKYASVVAQIDQKKVQPLVKKADAIKLDPNKLAADVDAVAKGVGLAADYVKLNGVIADFSSSLTAALSDTVRAVGPKATNASTSLNTLDQNIQAKLPTLEAAINNYSTIVGTLQAALGAASPLVKGACNLMEQTNNATAGVASGGLDGDPVVQNLAPLLAAQGGKVNAPPATTDLPNVRAAVDNCLDDIAYLQGLAAALNNEGTAVQGVLTDLLTVLQNLSGPGGLIPDAAGALGKIGQDAPGIANRLSNPDCPATLEQVVRQGRGNCGSSQLFRLVGNANAQAARGIDTNLVPAILGLKRLIPGLQRTLGQVVGLVDSVGVAFDNIPGIMEGTANKLGGTLPFLNGVSGKAGSAGDALARTNASMIIMNERGQAGEAVPYGDATGAGDPVTLAAWQITTTAATPHLNAALTQIIIALVLILIGAGFGTAMYLRNPNSPGR